VPRKPALLLVVVLAAACAAEPVPVVPGEVRILSLSPAVTEVLVALDARDELVGVDRYSLALPGVGDVPSLGALFSPDLERALELRPTLVFGVTGEHQRAFFDKLRAGGVRVETLSPYTLDEVLTSYERVAELIGRPQAGIEMARRAREDLDSLRASVSDEVRSVAIVLERDPLYVVAGGSFVSELVEIAGGRNVFADLGAAYPVVSVEVLVERAPQVLIDTTLPADADAATLQAARDRWHSLPWRGRVETVPQGMVTLPGARLAEAARMLRARIRGGGA